MYDGSYERVGDINIVVEGVCSFFLERVAGRCTYALADVQPE